MKKILFIMMAIFAMVACSKDDEIKPTTPPETHKDPITWSKSSSQYFTIIWHHRAKGDSCTVSYEYQTFNIGRNYNTGECYVKHTKATEPIEISVNTQDKTMCTGCNSFERSWYLNVDTYKYYFWWGSRKYWIKDLPSDIK